MVYTFAELQKATDSFAENTIVGRGGFGVVFEGKIRCCSVAIKKLTEVSNVQNLIRAIVIICKSL